MAQPSKRALIVDHVRFSSLIAKMLSGSFEAKEASEGVDAISILQAEPPDILIVDEGISGSGVRLAELVGMSPKYCHIPVILTSTRPSPETIMRARNAGVSSYLAKPFRPSELISRIDAALTTMRDKAASAEESDDEDAEAADDSDSKESFRDRVKQIDGLPSFPATHAEIMTLARSESATSDDLAEKIQLDPSFLAQILKLVNSSHYGFRKRVTSLKLAVTLMGMEEIANLVMAAQVFERLGKYEGGGGLDIEAFWRHSVGTAFISRAIAKKLQSEIETSFLGGLLHDLGKVVLDRYFADYYGAVFKEIQSSNVTILEAEQSVLGVGHGEIGGQLASEWKFGDHYVNCIENHHEPMEARRYARLVRVVHIADALCRQMEYGSGGDDTVPEVNAEVLDSFSIGVRGLDILQEAAKSDLEEAESFLGALAN